MSAVATTAAPVSDAVAVHLVPTNDHSTTQQVNADEQKRWMIWFGIPALVAAFFVGLTFSTNQAWVLGLAIAAIVFDIFILVWLAMTSDTNGAIGEPSSGH